MKRQPRRLVIITKSHNAGSAQNASMELHPDALAAHQSMGAGSLWGLRHVMTPGLLRKALDASGFDDSYSLRPSDFRYSRVFSKAIPIGASMSEGKRFFGPRVSGLPEAELDQKPPTYMSSNLRGVVHAMVSQSPGTHVNPQEILNRVRGEFKAPEIRTVLGDSPHIGKTKVEKQEFLDSLDNNAPYKSAGWRDGSSNPVRMHILQIPGHDNPISNTSLNGHTEDYKAFTPIDHLRVAHNVDGQEKFTPVSSEDDYRVLLTDAPHQAPDEGHWPYHAHGRSHKAVGHTRGTTVIDPKTGKRIYQIFEAQSDVHQMGRGIGKWVTDSNGERKVIGEDQDTAIGNRRDWHEALMNHAIAYALETGHDGIEILPNTANGGWLRNPNQFVRDFYGPEGPLVKHLRKQADQFDAKLEPAEYAMDYHEADNLMSPGRPSQDQQNQWRQERQDPRFATTATTLGNLMGMSVDPNNMFGVNIPLLTEGLATKRVPGQGRGHQSSGALERQFGLPDGSLMDLGEFWPVAHQAYHDDSNNEPLPRITAHRLMFPDSMKAYHETDGIGLWGVSGPKRDAELRKKFGLRG